MGLEPFADFKIRQFSTGMKKRLAFTQARLFGPEVLLLDEPYTALDEKGVRLVNGFIKEYTAGGGTVFMATHNRHFAWRCDGDDPAQERGPSTDRRRSGPVA